MQDTKNRQNSVTTDDNTLQLSFKNMQIEMIDAAKTNYEWAISAGIAKEVARVILPEGNTVSRLYINGTLRSFVHFLEVRLGNGTQKEHMMIARECAQVISQIFPYIKTQD
jgi:thymidylate synthase (FAD)